MVCILQCLKIVSALDSQFCAFYNHRMRGAFGYSCMSRHWIAKTRTTSMRFSAIHCISVRSHALRHWIPLNRTGLRWVALDRTESHWVALDSNLPRHDRFHCDPVSVTSIATQGDSKPLQCPDRNVSHCIALMETCPKRIVEPPARFSLKGPDPIFSYIWGKARFIMKIDGIFRRIMHRLVFRLL